MEHVDLKDKVIVVTGATSGIGFQTAAQLTKMGAFVIGVGRARERCDRAAALIREGVKDARIVYLTADLSSVRQVKALASDIKNTLKERNMARVDTLINDAGTVSSWYVSTEDGFELQFAVNHLAAFLLTHELLPLLRASEAGRVITVSSGSHYRTRMCWKDVFMRKHYNTLRAYKQSKLANVLFSTELNRRLGVSSSVRAFAADPGLVNTEIGLKGTGGIVKWVWQKRASGGVPPAQAASSIVYLAAEPALQKSSEVYWKECRPMCPSRYSQRPEEGKRLWELSEKMCGLSSLHS